MKTIEQRIKEQEQRIQRRAERVRDIVDHTENKLVQPGYYDVTETDGGGMRDYVVFTIKVENEINLKDLALKLIEEKEYMSPWNDLRIRPAQAPKVFTV